MDREIIFMLYSMGMGIVIPFIYDWVIIARIVCRHNVFFLAMEDILFWFFCAISVFYLMQTQGNGTLRWFAILGAIAGILFYKKTFGRLLVKGISSLLLTIKNKLTIPWKLLKIRITKR